MPDLTFRTLAPDDLPQMYETFIEAFSQYSVNMNMSMAAFESRMIHKLKLDFELSPAVFDGDKMIGFIFYTINEYEGKRTAYNGGTGVLPDYWGHNITQRLHDYIIPQLQNSNVQRCILEVITTNEKAINAYKKAGFTKSKKYKCFKLTGNLPKRELVNKTGIQVPKNAHWEAYENLATAQPSMLDSSKQLQYNIENETILEAIIDNEIIAYAIFQAKLGRISQMAVSEGFRNQGIATALISKIHEISVVKPLTVINVEEQEIAIVTLLEGLGFENQINQWEMELLLNF